MSTAAPGTWGGECQIHHRLLPCPVCSSAPIVQMPVGNAFTPKPVTTRVYRAECPSCRGSGQSGRPVEGTTNFWPCAGCKGAGWVTISETTTVGGESE